MVLRTAVEKGLRSLVVLRAAVEEGLRSAGWFGMIMDEINAAMIGGNVARKLGISICPEKSESAVDWHCFPLTKETYRPL